MRKTSRKDFLARKKVGLILRVYATKPEDVPARVSMVDKAVEIASQIKIDGKKLINRIDVLVWADKKYKEADCGKTYTALYNHFFARDYVLPNGFHISKFNYGDIFCAILNHGIAIQLRNGCDYSLIVSSEAFSYMTTETMTAMVDAACNGALAIGVAINELTQSILEGRVANTFAMWHNISLSEVGSFDLKAAKPANEFSAHYMKGWSKEKNDNIYYHLAGVEEVIPLARLVDNFGSCIAPILPQGEGVQRYQVPDPVKSPELWQLHISKMGTKLERQSALLASAGFDPSFLKGGIMPDVDDSSIKREESELNSDIKKVIESILRSLEKDATYFKKISVFLSEKMDMEATQAEIEEYLSSTYWADMAMTGDEMNIQDERVCKIKKHLTESDKRILVSVNDWIARVIIKIEKEAKNK